MDVLVLGASGYIGSRLVPALVGAGHRVRAGARDVEKLNDFWWLDQVTATPVDVADSTQLADAMRGMDAVVYLVHGMGGDDFETADRDAAIKVRALANESDVARLVYLSGIVPEVPEEELSAHIRSRLEVEKILLGSSAVTIVLRAAMIVGASSTSFEVLAQLSRRLPVTLLPSWMDTKVEPVAVTDVVDAVLLAMKAETESTSLDLGGGESVSYSELLKRFAEHDHIDRAQIKIPLVPKGLVAEIASRIVDVPTSTVRSLIESLQHDMVADQQQSQAALPGARVGIDESFERALRPQTVSDPAAMDPMGAIPGDPSWADTPES